MARSLGFADEVNARRTVSRAVARPREIVRRDGGPR
jgi:hypothetical protein